MNIKTIQTGVRHAAWASLLIVTAASPSFASGGSHAAHAGTKVTVGADFGGGCTVELDADGKGICYGTRLEVRAVTPNHLQVYNLRFENVYFMLENAPADIISVDHVGGYTVTSQSASAFSIHNGWRDINVTWKLGPKKADTSRDVAKNFARQRAARIVADQTSLADRLNRAGTRNVDTFQGSFADGSGRALASVVIVTGFG